MDLNVRRNTLCREKKIGESIPCQNRRSVAKKKKKKKNRRKGVAEFPPGSNLKINTKREKEKKGGTKRDSNTPDCRAGVKGESCCGAQIRGDVAWVPPKTKLGKKINIPTKVEWGGKKKKKSEGFRGSRQKRANQKRGHIQKKKKRITPKRKRTGDPHPVTKELEKENTLERKTWAQEVLPRDPVPTTNGGNKIGAGREEK